jgi:hypothetical protein
LFEATENLGGGDAIKLKSAVAALALLLCFTAHICVAAVKNVALKVGLSDLYTAVPLCSYCYAQDARQGIMPDMTVENLGFALMPCLL